MEEFSIYKTIQTTITKLFKKIDKDLQLYFTSLTDALLKSKEIEFLTEIKQVI